MYKILRASKDTYVTDRIVNSVRCESGNVGAASTLDLFKLYAIANSGSTYYTELSRLLIHFDLDPIRNLIATNKIDVGNSSFDCHLKLFDVYGGQPTPADFSVVVNPLSRSFDEGIGRDIVQYSDEDVCNFLTASHADGVWFVSGCGRGREATTPADFITALDSTPLEFSQYFATGEENLDVDVTPAISASLSSVIPDEGFRIALSGSLEWDEQTYFVKRFASRHAYNEAKRPQLIIKFDDSIQDDSQLLMCDVTGTLFFYNYSMGAPSNILSASSRLTGSNCIALTMSTEISGGWHNIVFSGSQHSIGTATYQTGIYSASFAINSADSIVASKLRTSGSVDFIPIWGSRDGTVGFLTGSAITVHNTNAFGSNQLASRYVISVNGLPAVVKRNSELHVRVTVFDQTSELVKLTKFFKNLPGVVVRDAHYSVRDAVTSEVLVPFDTQKNSTRLSSDMNGMWFKLDTSNFTLGRNYVIDILLATLGGEITFIDASSNFKVSDMQ